MVRVTASGLSSRLGFSIDDVDDLRLALDELCFTLIGKGSETDQLHLTYQITSDSLTIEGTVAPTGSHRSSEATLGEFSQQILVALVDEHRVWSEDGVAHFSLTKNKAASSSQ